MFSCKSTGTLPSFVQVAAEATETTQPDKERNSCLQLTALRLTAFHLPPRLSLADNGSEQGGSHLSLALPPEEGAVGWGYCLSSRMGRS
jgi:hypothetical protein